jgi:hypothetical protein
VHSRKLVQDILIYAQALLFRFVPNEDHGKRPVEVETRKKTASGNSLISSKSTYRPKRLDLQSISRCRKIGLIRAKLGKALT